MKSAIGKPKPKLLLADLRQLIAGSPSTVIFAQGLVQKSLEPDKVRSGEGTLCTVTSQVTGFH